jgi:phosphoesterase RecJ-like protein
VSGSNGSTPARTQMLDELRGAQRFLLATHENPDGDALGSLDRSLRIQSLLEGEERA